MVFKYVYITTCYLPKSDKGNNKDTPTYNNFFQVNFLHERKPIWGDKAGLRLACIERCVPGHTNLDGRVAYNPRDLENIPKWTISQCNAWLDKRCSGAAKQ